MRGRGESEFKKGSMGPTNTRGRWGERPREPVCGEQCGLEESARGDARPTRLFPSTLHTRRCPTESNRIRPGPPTTLATYRKLCHCRAGWNMAGWLA
jgi:hypothetical protein